MTFLRKMSAELISKTRNVLFGDATATTSTASAANFGTKAHSPKNDRLKKKEKRKEQKYICRYCKPYGSCFFNSKGQLYKHYNEKHGSYHSEIRARLEKEEREAAASRSKNVSSDDLTDDYDDGDQKRDDDD